MPLTASLKTLVTPDVKQRFESLTVSRGTTPSDTLREFVYGYVDEGKLPIDGRKGVGKLKDGSRWKVLNTRLTTGEWERAWPIIKAEAKSETAWVLMLVRERIINGPQLRKDELLAVERSTYQLRSIGRNLNQMVRAINEGKADRGQFSEQYAERLAEYISESIGSINELIKSASRRDLE